MAKFNKKTEQEKCVNNLIAPHIANLDSKLKELSEEEVPHLNILDLSYLSK